MIQFLKFYGVSNLWRIDKRILAQFDIFSIILIIPLVLTSNWLISEAVPALAQKQLAYVGVATLTFLAVFLLPIRRMSWLIPSIYWISIFLLLMVEFFGHARLGAQRWIDIPFINATIQPSEFVKPRSHFNACLSHQQISTANAGLWTQRVFKNSASIFFYPLYS